MRIQIRKRLDLLRGSSTSDRFVMAPFSPFDAYYLFSRFVADAKKMSSKLPLTVRPWLRRPATINWRRPI